MNKTMYRQIFFYILIINCFFSGINTASAQKFQDTFPKTFDYSNWDSLFTIHIFDIATLPNNVVFLSGCYRTPSDIVHPALFISKDEGRTWQKIPMLFANSRIDHLQTVGTSHVWAIITWTVEGAMNCTNLIYSTDAGETWNSSDISHINTYMQDQVTLNFFDELHGLLSVNSTSYQGGQTYYTEDGGEKWIKLWNSQRNQEIETSYIYPNPDAEYIPPHAPLWTSEYEYYKVTGVVRVREDYDMQEIQIEAKQYGESGWKRRSTIPMYYTEKQNKFIPYFQPE